MTDNQKWLISDIFISIFIMIITGGLFAILFYKSCLADHFPEQLLSAIGTLFMILSGDIFLLIIKGDGGSEAI